MSQNQYTDRPQRIRSGGGSVRVTLASNVGQGNGGTSLKCAGCWIQPVIANTAVVRWNIGAAASAILGQDLARPQIYDGATEASAAAAQPLWVPIDDVSKLYFYSTQADAVVDITYLTD
ncbi:MAG: hypothetical protein ACXABY_05075 [Candidatus Thorarchaeota archaeon]|jgi:hypothetical protein